MKTPTTDARYLPLLTGFVAVILLGSSGIAAVKAWAPGSTDMAAAAHPLDTLPPAPPELGGAQAQIPPAARAGDARARVKCAECGVVVSTREIEQFATASNAGGGATSGGGDKVAEQSTRSYEVTVRMKDGTRRVFMDATPGNWRPGQLVTLIEGAKQSND